MSGDLRVVVATNAFGMGVDKENVRCVVHWEIPGTVEAYYQEIGRAGRDNKPSRIVLFFRESDRRIHEFFIRSANPPADWVRSIWTHLKDNISPQLIIDKTELVAALPDDATTRDVGGCLVALERLGYLRRLPAENKAQHRLVLTKAGQPLVVNEDEFNEQRQNERAKLDEMFNYARSWCRRRFILEYFGQSPPSRWVQGDCGRCDACENRLTGKATPKPLTPKTRSMVIGLLTCMATLNRPLSANLIAKVATGSKDKTVKAFRFDRLSTHGVLSNLTIKEVKVLLDALVQANAIEAAYTTRQVRGREQTYRELKVSKIGADLLRNGTDGFSITLPDTNYNSRKKRHRNMVVDQVLLQSLHNTRAQLAALSHTTPQQVIPDSVLTTVAISRPSTMEALRECSGLDERRLRHFGALLLDLVAKRTDSTTG